MAATERDRKFVARRAAVVTVRAARTFLLLMRRAESVVCVVDAEAPPAVAVELERWGRRQHVPVIRERRDGDRRRRERRAQRRPAHVPQAFDTRSIRHVGGRRVAARRREVLQVASPVPLPRPVKAHRAAISFFHPLEPNPRRRLDVLAASLIVRIQGGETHLFDELYRLCFPLVRDYLASVLRGRDEAEDAAQEVFLRAYGALESYELGAASPRAWLLALARNLAIDRLRRRPLTTLAPDDLERLRSDHALEPYLPGWLGDADLLMLFERLPVPQQQVLLLRYLLDLSSSEIASALHTSPENARQLHARGLSFLRTRLTALGREPKLRQPRLPMRGLLPESRTQSLGRIRA
jgi:RNA polymerase sigma-70 factor (ECF subfamily)